MFNNTQSHTFFNEGKIASKSGAVVLYRASMEEDSGLAVKKFIGAAFMALFLGVLTLQAGWVYNANAEGNPVTSPVTAQQTPTVTPTPSPTGSSSGSSAGSSSSSQTQNQTSNPITSPENPSPTPSASSSGAPITSSETSPSPSASTTTNSGSTSTNSGGGSSSSGGSVGAPSCNNEAPKSAPKIVSAVTSGKNEITLKWEKAKDPVTKYVIAYGFEKGKPIYGNPDIGNVTSYAVKGLSGGMTYYFKVRAGNDCQPGAYSEEIGVKVGGKFINAPAQGFKAGVLGKTIKKNIALTSATPAPVVSGKPQLQVNNSGTGLFGKVFNFLSNIFKP